MPKFNPIKSLLFVGVQFAALGAIAATGPLWPSNPILLAVELIGLALGVWAVLAMRIGNFNIAPDPFSWTKIVTSGPYGLIRHPMYLSLLVLTLPLIVEQFDVLRLIFWLVLLIDLVLKLNFEESLLVARLPGYKEYRGQSYRLIPFVY